MMSNHPLLHTTSRCYIMKISLHVRKSKTIPSFLGHLNFNSWRLSLRLLDIKSKTFIIPHALELFEVLPPSRRHEVEDPSIIPRSRLLTALPPSLGHNPSATTLGSYPILLRKSFMKASPTIPRTKISKVLHSLYFIVIQKKVHILIPYQQFGVNVGKMDWLLRTVVAVGGWNTLLFGCRKLFPD